MSVLHSVVQQYCMMSDTDVETLMELEKGDDSSISRSLRHNVRIILKFLQKYRINNSSDKVT